MQAEGKTPLPPLLEIRGIRKTFASRRLFAPVQTVVAAEDAGET